MVLPKFLDAKPTYKKVKFKHHVYLNQLTLFLKRV